MIKDFSCFDNRENFIDVWQPDKEMIVLGRFSDEKIIHEKAIKDGIKIVRRVGGGGTVFLDQTSIIVDIGIKEKKLKPVNAYFDFFNHMLVEALKNQNIPATSDQDFYDIRIDDRKIGGVSLAIRKDMVLYGVSLIQKNSLIAGIETYLNHPPREPEYRNKRSHSDFLTSMDFFVELSISQLKKDLCKSLIKQEAKNA